MWRWPTGFQRCEELPQIFKTEDKPVLKMTKKHAAPVKNPLLQAFGLAIQKARKKEKKLSDDLAKDLGISASLLRLIESGTAALQPNKSIDLIKALPNTPIEFRQLAMLLVACLISESRWSDARTRPQALSGLADLDRGLGIAIQPLAKAWTALLAESDPGRKSLIFDRLAMPERLLEFLEQKTDPTPPSIIPLAEHWGHKLVEGTSPIYLDLAEAILTELKRFPPKVTVQEMTKWETSHIGRFRRIYAVLETIKILPETYEDFDWRFIADSGLRVISMSEARQERNELKNFKRFLDKLRKAPWISSTRKSVEEICALRFASERSGDFEQFKRLQREQQVGMRESSATAAKSAVRRRGQEQKRQTDVKNAWIYEVVPTALPHSGRGYHVVFIDDLDIDSGPHFEARVCSWEETEQWTDLLKNFWPD